MTVGGQGHAPAALPLGNEPGTRTRGLMGPKVDLNGCEKCHPQRDSIPGPSSL
jgi:hypothetical protein